MLNSASGECSVRISRKYSISIVHRYLTLMVFSALYQLVCEIWSDNNEGNKVKYYAWSHQLTHVEESSYTFADSNI